jgi:hypothetical protein
MTYNRSSDAVLRIRGEVLAACLCSNAGADLSDAPRLGPSGEVEWPSLVTANAQEMLIQTSCRMFSLRRPFFAIQESQTACQPLWLPCSERLKKPEQAGSSSFTKRQHPAAYETKRHFHKCEVQQSSNCSDGEADKYIRAAL